MAPEFQICYELLVMRALVVVFRKSLRTFRRKRTIREVGKMFQQLRHV